MEKRAVIVVNTNPLPEERGFVYLALPTFEESLEDTRAMSQASREKVLFATSYPERT